MHAVNVLSHKNSHEPLLNNKDRLRFSSINSLLKNKKYLEFGKNAKEFINKFQWSKIIEEYKKILN